MSSERPTESQDAMADEWAAALEEAGAGGQPAGGVATPAQAIASASSGVARPHAFDALSPADGAPIGDIERVMDIPVQLSVEIGRTRISIKNILQLSQGSVIELDALAGEPMDVLINGYLIAQGEVVVVNEKFGIRLTDIVTPAERMRRLNRA
ncbi:MAG: flagellar motor switch protein FliN [Lautropia sp.]